MHIHTHLHTLTPVCTHACTRTPTSTHTCMHVKAGGASSWAAGACWFIRFLAVCRVLCVSPRWQDTLYTLTLSHSAPSC